MVFPVHLQRSAVVAIVDCPDRGQFIGSRSLKQVALQWIWLFQETPISCPFERPWINDVKLKRNIENETATKTSYCVLSAPFQYILLRAQFRLVGYFRPEKASLNNQRLHPCESRPVAF